MADWREEFREGFKKLVDSAVVSGARQADVFQAAVEEIERLRVENDRDPDPADDESEAEIEEPANDWPAARP
ncbi:hypothetical protein [Oryzifoliimicrobium ureilyticus]|uniref:hypothetical protein n=1 Tax=Oryzifoliimicrobium ureilyticus TaxID=3113724 RepID=UPI0030762C32